MSDLLALLVVIPLLGALASLAAGIGRDRTGWYVAAATLAVQVAAAATVAGRVLTGDRISYAVGGYEPPFGIELVVDGLSATMVVLVAVVALGVLAYARRAGPRSNRFYTTYLLLVAGLTGMSVTGDAFNLYVFLEITGLTAYALVASGDRGRSAVAGLKYLLVGTFGASLYLLGIGYAYVATGTLNMADLSTQLAAVGYGSPLVRAAFAFVVVGLFVKVAMFPLHTWQPEAYAGAPDSVSALIASLVSTVSAYALVRLVLTVFTPEFLEAVPFARTLLAAVAAVSIVVGSLLAVAQTEIKRMLAYSSVSQFGLVVAALSVTNGTALVGLAVHLVGHAVMKGGLFLTAGLVSTGTGGRSVREYDGLAARMPVAAGAFGVLVLAMVGVPPAVGFLGKWYIVLGTLEAGAWGLTAVILLSTLLTLAYFARLLERMYFRDSPAGTADAAAVADGGDGDARGVSTGMYAAAVAAALLAVALSAAVPAYEAALAPTIEVLLP
ncbi:monovalent cation/H+ antiporter subunit D family protein [Halobaculum lipolyticum]|uniref:Monovalent cation/H+ antiporter subunit D family protein n=1 Tax=Halobaculum lipolyticum TaxID=3032001 RepID=A0ABD5W4N8_9EURY|nr:monovalent cation/H+ antiporter subunit D family protein [Halobaculum sp. DT31]